MLSDYLRGQYEVTLLQHLHVFLSIYLFYLVIVVLLIFKSFSS